MNNDIKKPASIVLISFFVLALLIASSPKTDKREQNNEIATQDKTETSNNTRVVTEPEFTDEQLANREKYKNLDTLDDLLAEVNKNDYESYTMTYEIDNMHETDKLVRDGENWFVFTRILNTIYHEDASEEPTFVNIEILNSNLNNKEEIFIVDTISENKIDFDPQYRREYKPFKLKADGIINHNASEESQQVVYTNGEIDKWFTIDTANLLIHYVKEIHLNPMENVEYIYEDYNKTSILDDMSDILKNTASKEVIEALSKVEENR